MAMCQRLDIRPFGITAPEQVSQEQFFVLSEFYAFEERRTRYDNHPDKEGALVMQFGPPPQLQEE